MALITTYIAHSTSFIAHFILSEKIIPWREPTDEQTLLDGKGYIRKRNEDAVIRYYLSYDNDE